MKKPKTYNLKRTIYETINQLATADGRSDSDWLNIHLGNTLPAKKESKPKTELVSSESKFNFKDERNDFKALQSLEFEYLVQNKYNLINWILYSSGELQILQGTVDKIIELSDPKTND